MVLAADMLGVVAQQAGAPPALRGRLGQIEAIVDQRLDALAEPLAHIACLPSLSTTSPSVAAWARLSRPREVGSRKLLRGVLLGYARWLAFFAMVVLKRRTAV